jgi:hypothetical protein
LDKVRPECDETGTIVPTCGRINNPVAGGFRAELLGERLTGWVGYAEVVMQGGLFGSIDGAKVVERAIKICDQLGIIRGILETADRF